MRAGREAEGRILGQEALVSGQSAECQLLMGMVQRELELAPAAAVARLGSLGGEPEADLPQQFASGQAESVAAANPHEGFDGGAFELRRRAPDEIADALEGTILLALFNGSGRGCFTPMAYEPQSNSYCSPLPAPCSLHRAPNVAHVDIGQP